MSFGKRSPSFARFAGIKPIPCPPFQDQGLIQAKNLLHRVVKVEMSTKSKKCASEFRRQGSSKVLDKHQEEEILERPQDISDDCYSDTTLSNTSMLISE